MFLFGIVGTAGTAGTFGTAGTAGTFGSVGSGSVGTVQTVWTVALGNFHLHGCFSHRPSPRLQAYRLIRPHSNWSGLGRRRDLHGNNQIGKCHLPTLIVCHSFRCGERPEEPT